MIFNIFRKKKKEKEKKEVDKISEKAVKKDKQSIKDKDQQDDNIAAKKSQDFVSGKQKQSATKQIQTKDKSPKASGKKTGRAYKVLLRPLVTEKATELGIFNQYVFEVSLGANKIEVARAIHDVYGVKPLKVRMIPVRGKSRRYGRVTGRTKAWKKTIITLKRGEKIEVYEGV